MEYTEQELNFLRTLKQKGVSQDVAFRELKKRKLQESSPTLARTLGTVDKAMEEGVPDYKPEKGVIGKTLDFSKGVTKGVIGTVENLTTKPLGTVIEKVSPEGSFGDRLGENLKTGADQMFGEIESGAGKAGELGGEIAASLVPVLGGAKIGAGAFKMLPKTGKIGQFLGSSLGSTVAAGAASGEEVSDEDLGLGLVMDTVLAGATKGGSKVLGKPLVALKDWAVKKLSQPVDTALEGLAKSKIKESDINILEQVRANDPQLGDLAKKYYTQAVEGATKPLDIATNTRTNTAMDLVKEDVSKFYKTIETNFKTVGKAIGNESKRLKGASKISTTNIHNNIKNDLAEEYGATILDNGKVQFGPRLQGMSAEQSLVQDIVDFVRPQKGKGGSLRNPKDILDMVQNVFGRMKKDNLDTQKIAANFRTYAKDALEELADSPYKSLAKEYVELMDLEDTLARTVKESGDSAPEFLRRIAGKAPGKTLSTIEEIQDYGKKYNIPEVENLLSKTYIAELMDRVAGNIPTQSLAGQQAEAIESTLVDTATRPIATLAKKGLQILTQSPEKREALEKFLETKDNPEIKEALAPFVKQVSDYIEKTELKKVPYLDKALRAIFMPD